MSVDLRKALEYKPRYRRYDDIDLVNGFYIPILSNAERYDRICGYFSSSILSAASHGYSAFCQNTNSKMRLIVGARLYEKDVNVINDRDFRKELLRMLEGTLIEELNKTINTDVFEKKRLQGLAWMIEKKILEVKVGVMVSRSGRIKPHMEAEFHGKQGLAYDSHNNIVHFEGGINESERAWKRNGDSISVHCSWQEGHGKHIKSAEEEFDELWNTDGINKKLGVAIVELPVAVAEKWIHYHRPINPSDLGEREQESKPDKPTSKRWRHQEDAVEIFMRVKKGILEMATGTGKTRTSLKIIEKLISSGSVNSVIISTPSNTDLARQWYSEVISYDFTCKPLTYRNFSSRHEIPLFLSAIKKSDKKRFPVLILFHNNIHKLLKNDKKDLLSSSLLITDEVHNFGSPANVKNLDGKLGHIPFKLGLSATPEREYDEIGSAFIEREIGETFFEFDLKKAIERGVLCEFDYEALEYQLSNKDKKEIGSYYAEAERRKKEGENRADVDKDIAMKISAVSKLSKEKLPLLSEFLKKKPQILDRCIIFVFRKKYGKLVQDIIHDFEREYHTYYAKDNKTELEAFSKGKLSLLITCHKLSEGIDIKTVKNIILLYSDRAKLETIQRIGRSLRVDPNDEQKKSFILDFVKKNEKDNIESADGKRYVWLKAMSGVKGLE